MLSRVEEYMRENEMTQKNSTVIVGVSGGADSVCLLHLLCQLCGKLFKNLIVVHVNHGIRGAQADADQQYVKQLCRQWQVPVKVFRADVRKLAREQKMTEEEAGRMFRYECFEKVAKEQNYPVIAVAHHRQDQAETVLFRLARGTGLTGLGGMLAVGKQRNYPVIRPLLSSSREEIEQYLRENSIRYCEDATNQCEDYQRNYIRHTILPAFQRLNEKTVDHIWELAEQAAQVSAYMQEQAQQKLQGKVLQKTAGQYEKLYAVPLQVFVPEPDVLAQEMIRQLLQIAQAQRKDISREHVVRILSGIRQGRGAVQLPNRWQIFCNGDLLLLGQKESFDPNEKKAVKQEMDARLKEKFEFIKGSWQGNGKIEKKSYTKIIDCAKIKGTLKPRFRKPGDRIVIDGQGHEKSLNRFFIDAKIPQYMRDEIPLVCDGEQVVWIVGYRLSAAYYVTEETVCVMNMIYQDRKE